MKKQMQKVMEHMWKVILVKLDQEMDLNQLCHELLSEKEKQFHGKLHP